MTTPQVAPQVASRVGATVGAARAADKAGDTRKAQEYYTKVAELTGDADASRSEFWTAVNYNVINRLYPEVATECQ